MRRLKTLPLIGLNLFLVVIYFATAELGLSLATLHSNVTPVWPPAGIAIASLVSLLLLISFVGTASLMTLVTGAVMNERRRAQADKDKLGPELELNRRRIEDMVAHVPGVVWESWGKPGSDSYRTEFVSRHIGKMLGYSADEWLSIPQFGCK